MGDAPWSGDACSLVEGFRRGEGSLAEELAATYAAIEASDLNASCHLDREALTAPVHRARPTTAHTTTEHTERAST